MSKTLTLLALSCALTFAQQKQTPEALKGAQVTGPPVKAVTAKETKTIPESVKAEYWKAQAFTQNLQLQFQQSLTSQQTALVEQGKQQGKELDRIIAGMMAACGGELDGLPNQPACKAEPPKTPAAK